MPVNANLNAHWGLDRSYSLPFGNYYW